MSNVDFRSDLIIRWPDPQPSHIPILKQAGIQAAILPKADPEFSKAGIATLTEDALKVFSLSQMPADPGTYAALSTGLWPGIRREPSRAGRDVEVVSASREPWVDSNAYLIAYLRALYPKAAPVLAYEANEAAGITEGRIVPFDTIVIALIEARVMGGNYILSLDPPFRKALLGNDAKAMAAWKELGLTAKWLTANKGLFGIEPPPIITDLVEPGRATAEIANLLFRRNASPRLISEVPAKLPPGMMALVTTSIKPPAPETAKRMLDLVSIGGVSLVTDDPSPNAWWRAPGDRLKAVKTQSDRVFYSFGKGTIVAYNHKIVDPSDHALDVIDIVGHPHRAVRVWNANSTIAVSSPGIVHLLNYSGRARGSDTQVRIQGVYKNATLLRPGSEPLPLVASRRGTTTEVFVPDVAFVGTLVFR
ncbi:MAG TPA: hypothetical protein VGL53_06235 [Bryobacteraceae bacterium]|jgi:hypothetical protein